MASFLIGIQARTNSTRFPNKAEAKLGDYSVLEMVIQNCNRAASYINKKMPQHKVNVNLLVPKDDPLAEKHRRWVHVVEGPENDLITRYRLAANVSDPDYIVRVTGDCPLLPSFVITKHITMAANGRADYITNSHPEYRTAPDGHDVEVFSRKMFDYIDEKAITDWDREHVGTYVKDRPPKWAKVVHLIGFTDQSARKLSVDTESDLETVQKELATIAAKEMRAREQGHEVTRF